MLKLRFGKAAVANTVRSLSLGSTILLVPSVLFAHVKWFCSYDVTEPTKPLSAVMDQAFFTVAAAFLAMIFLGFCLDGWISARWLRFETSNAFLADLQEKMVRLGTGAFFICTWTIGLNILTPELHTQSGWISAIQFMIAFATGWRRTCIVAGVGIGILYLYGISQYGFFHMLDYVYFLGIAIYLAFTSLSSQRLLQLRQPIMVGCLAFSLMWTAIEKLLYPQWSQQLMLKHGHMMMGMNFNIFIVISAFVEFTLSFYLATGRGLLRLGSFALLFVFISAMPEFGALDVVGHFPLVAILSVPFLAGDSSLQRFWRLPKAGIVANAAATCVLYVTVLILFLTLYHGVEWLEYHS